MKEYRIDFDVTFSARISVYAATEESARAQAIEKMNDEPHFYTRKGAHVSTIITDVWTND
jgi:hypothetical protein